MAENANIKLEDLKIGIKLPAPIFDAKNKSLLLLNHGVVLSAQFITKLRERGITSVSIDANFANAIKGRKNSSSSEVATNEQNTNSKKTKKTTEIDLRKKLVLRKPIKVIKPSESKISEVKTRHKANSKVMSSVYEMIKSAFSFSKGQVQSVTLSSLEQMADDMDVFVQQAILASETGEEHTHALRVSELAMATATIMNVPEEQVKLLGLGCLLSRCGATEASLELSRSSRKLSMIEMMEIKKSPARAFDILAKCAGLNMITRQVAYQINERWDGSGYPRGRVGLQIHPLARIAAICDVFVALTTNRPHRKSMSGYSAVQEVIKETKKRKFDPAVVRGLLQTISIFPLGTYLKLSNDHIGKVIRSTPEIYDRPTLLLVSTLDHEVLELSKNPEVKVLDVIEDEIELAMLVSGYSSYKNTDESGDQDETENMGYVDDLTEDNFLDDSQTVWEEENKETCAPPEKQKMFNFS